MNTWRAAFVAVRVLALYLIARALILVAEQASFISRGPSDEWWPVVAGAIAIGIAGVFVWLGAIRLAARIGSDADAFVPAETAIDSRLAIGTTDLLRVALAVVGVFVAAESVGQIIDAIGSLLSPRPERYLFASLERENWTTLIAGLVRFAVGVALAASAGRLARALDKRRPAPQAPPGE